MSSTATSRGSDNLEADLRRGVRRRQRTGSDVEELVKYLKALGRPWNEKRSASSCRDHRGGRTRNSNRILTALLVLGGGVQARLPAGTIHDLRRLEHRFETTFQSSRLGVRQPRHPVEQPVNQVLVGLGFF